MLCSSAQHNWQQGSSLSSPHLPRQNWYRPSHNDTANYDSMILTAYHHHIGRAWQFNVCLCCGTLSSLSACSICYCICAKTSCIADDMDNKPSSRSLYSSEVSAIEHCYARMMSKAQLEMASIGAGEAWARIAVHCGHEGRVHGASKSTHLYYSIGGCANMLDSARSSKTQQEVSDF